MVQFYNTYYAFLPGNKASEGGYIKVQAPDIKFAFERLLQHFEPMPVLISSRIDKDLYPKGELQHFTFKK